MLHHGWATSLFRRASGGELDQSEIADIPAGRLMKSMDKQERLAVGDVGMPDEVPEVHYPPSHGSHHKGDESQHPQDTVSTTYMSIKDAVYEFGPCAGGYANACKRILQEIANNPEFLFETQSEFFTHWPIEPSYERRVASEFRDSLHTILEKRSDSLADHNFKTWLEDDLGVDVRVSVAQTRAIWVPQKPSNIVSNANLNPYWSEYEALAWIVTRDIRLVGLFQEQYQIDKLNEYLGLIKYISLENCDASQNKKLYQCGSGIGTAKWKLCQCLSNAWDDMRRFAASKSQGPISKLSFDVTRGIISLSPRSSDGEVEFLKKHIFQHFPPSDTEHNFAMENGRRIGPAAPRPIHPPQGGEATPRRPGRPKLCEKEYMAEFERRANANAPEDGLEASLKQETNYLIKWLNYNHSGKQHPQAKTIENRIREKFRRAKERHAKPRNPPQN